jgi:four helix bundle protein
MIGSAEVQERRPSAYTFEDLDVWKRAFGVSLIIHQTTLNFPKIEQYALADQIRRSSKSICANIAEGFAKQKTSKVEFKRFLMMALGSSNEMLVWLRYSLELKYITQDEFKAWHEEYSIISKMINSLHEKCL